MTWRLFVPLVVYPYQNEINNRRLKSMEFVVYNYLQKIRRAIPNLVHSDIEWDRSGLFLLYLP